MAWYYEGIEGSKAGQFGATMMGGGFLGDAAAPRHIWKHYGVDGEPDMMAWAYVRDFREGWAPPDEPPNSSKVKRKKIRSAGGGSSERRRTREGRESRSSVADVVTSGPAGGSFLGEGILKYAAGLLIVVAVLVWGFAQNPLGYLAENDEMNRQQDAAAEANAQSTGAQATAASTSAAQATGTGTGSAASNASGATSANAAAASPSGTAYDNLSSSLRGSYAYADGDAASDAAAGGHFSKFMVTNFDESAGTLNIDFGWCDKGSSSPNISGDLKARYVNDGDLGDFSVFRCEGDRTNANGTVKTTAELRVYPADSKITIANMQVVATDPSDVEIYRMSIGSYDLVKK